MLQNVIYALLTDPSPGQDLFSEAWTEGNLYSIQPIVNVLGTFSVWVISIVGFGIVIFSILKNALSGLYVINPKFWDKVDQVKEQMTNGATSAINEVTGKSGNAAVQKLGGFFVWLLNLIPNVKALTDFDEDAEIDKKQYFARSIPLLIAQIFIGMIIFMGYPAKIAEWVGSAGTYAIAAVINNVDPVTLVTNATDMFTIYKFATDGSTDPFEQAINDMASSMTATMATKYSDMDKGNVQDIAYQIEQNLLNSFNSNGARTVLGANGGYQYSVSTIIQTSTPAVSDAYQDIGNGVKQAMATNGTVSYKYWIQASSLLTAQHTTKLGANDYMVWTVTATPVAVSNISTANVIACAGISGTPVVNGSNFSITITGITVGNGTDDIKGSLGKVVSVEFINSSGNVVDTFNATLQTASVGQMSGATPILTFSASDKDRYTQAQSQSSYMRIALVGEWSKTVTDNNAQTTVRITEFRLALNNQQLTWLLSTWTDVDSQRYAGVRDLSADTLKWTNSSGN